MGDSIHLQNGQPTAPRTLEEAMAEIERLQHLVRRHRRDNRLLRAMTGEEEEARKNYQLERAKTENIVQTLLHHIEDMMYLLDEELRLQTCSEGGMALLVSSQLQKVQGRLLADVLTARMEPAGRILLEQQCRKALQTAQRQHIEAEIFFKNGSSTIARVVAAPVSPQAGAAAGVLLRVQDITAVVQAQQTLREAAQAKATLLDNISHEVHPPASTIKSAAELLALTDLDATQRSYVGSILSSAQALIAVINDIVDYSRIDAGKIELLEGPYKAADLVAEVANTVPLRHKAEGVRFLVDAAPTLPTELWGDDGRLKQVMGNLLANALEHTTEGFVRLRLFATQNAGEYRLHCQVQDTGKGIAPAQQASLFNAFAGSSAKPQGGLGLSIAKRLVVLMGGEISVDSQPGEGSTFSFWVPQQVLDPAPMAGVHSPQRHKVLVWGEKWQTENTAAMLKALGITFQAVEPGMLDNAGKLQGFTHCIYDATPAPKQVRRLRAALPGCVFAALKNMQDSLEISDNQEVILFLPLIVNELARFLNRTGATVAEEMETGVLRLAEDFGETLAVADTRVLVVDDNEINLMVAVEMLRTFGCQVECADSGKEALVLCQNTTYDLIFLDHMMPEMDGTQVAAQLRGEEGQNRQTPIVALTANVNDEMQSYYVRCGMDDYIGKPAEFGDLARVLRRWLPPQKLREAPAQSPVP